MLVAYPNGFNYNIASDSGRNSETYHARDRLREAGCFWSGSKWDCSESMVDALGIEKMVRVTHTTCHESETSWENQTWCKSSKAVVGNYIDVFCGRCDSRSNRRILEIVG